MTSLEKHEIGIRMQESLGAAWTIDYSNAIDIARFGYHNATFQTNNTVQEGVKAIVASKGGFSILSTHNTYYISPQQSYMSGDASIGEAYSVLQDPVMVVSGIGSTHQSKFAKGPNEGFVVVTNEPAVRLFDGNQYGEDLTDGSIKRNELQKLNSMIILGYDSNSGIFMWGMK